MGHTKSIKTIKGFASPKRVLPSLIFARFDGIIGLMFRAVWNCNTRNDNDCSVLKYSLEELD